MYYRTIKQARETEYWGAGIFAQGVRKGLVEEDT